MKTYAIEMNFGNGGWAETTFSERTTPNAAESALEFLSKNVTPDSEFKLAKITIIDSPEQ